MFVLLSWVLQGWFSFVLESIEMTPIFWAIVYFVLLLDNFKYSDFLYNQFLEDVFVRNTSFFNYVQQTIK